MSIPSYVWFAGAPRIALAAFSPTTGAEPAPADTVAYGAALGGTWTDTFKTQGGITFKPGFTNRDIESDQAEGEVGALRVANNADLTVPMLSADLATIKKMVGQALLTAGAAGGEDVLGVGGGGPFVDAYSVVIEGLAPGSTAAAKLYRRLYIPKVIASEAPEMAFKRDEEIVLNATFKAYIDEDQDAGERLWKVFNEIPAA